MSRCWNTNNPLYIKYHDEEWGVPVHDDREMFEYLALGGFQAGLTWELILNKREAFRNAFNHFDPKTVAKYTDMDLLRIYSNPSIIRNRSKISATINNALLFIKIQREFGSFDSFVWGFVDNRTVNNAFTKCSDVPSESDESAALSKELRKRGFQFVGPTICYAFMQATGLVNDHLVSCFRYEQVQKMQKENQPTRRCKKKHRALVFLKNQKKLERIDGSQFYDLL